jgi:hypothetical protein
MGAAWGPGPGVRLIYMYILYIHPSREIDYYMADRDFWAKPLCLVCDTTTTAISFLFDSEKPGTLSWGPTALHLASLTSEMQTYQSKPCFWMAMFVPRGRFIICSALPVQAISAMIRRGDYFYFVSHLCQQSIFSSRTHFPGPGGR